jgi:hypothetical protein
MPSIIREVGETFSTLYKGFSVTLRSSAKRRCPVSRYSRSPARRKRIRKMCRLLPLRSCVPRKLHLHRGRRKHGSQSHLRRRTLRQGLQYRLLALHFLRLLRGRLSHRRHHARPQHRARSLRHQRSHLPQRKITRTLAASPHRRNNLIRQPGWQRPKREKSAPARLRETP